MKKIMVTLALILIASTVNAKNLHHERWYQDRWCQGKGKTEVRMPDNTRCDCVTATHAIEFDFSKKWYEAVGQSLYYSLQTGKRAGIALIIESEKDRKYWIRMNSTIKHFELPIDTWMIQP